MYFFFDVETTGLPANFKAPASDVNNWPRVVELAYAVTDKDGAVVKTRDFIIKPDGFTIPTAAADLHGITQEVAELDGVMIETALSCMLNDYSVHNCQFLVAHNYAFDSKVVGAEFFRNRGENPISAWPSICTMENSVQVCKIPGAYGYKWPKLRELYFFLFGKYFENEHNALSDVLATVECFNELNARRKPITPIYP